MKALLILLRTDPTQIDALSIQQIVALCGNGKLTDSSECSNDFRDTFTSQKARICSNTRKPACKIRLSVAGSSFKTL